MKDAGGLYYIACPNIFSSMTEMASHVYSTYTVLWHSNVSTDIRGYGENKTFFHTGDYKQF